MNIMADLEFKMKKCAAEKIPAVSTVMADNMWSDNNVRDMLFRRTEILEKNR